MPNSWRDGIWHSWRQTECRSRHPDEALTAELAGIGAQMAAEWAETAGDAGQAAIDTYKMAE